VNIQAIYILELLCTVEPHTTGVMQASADVEDRVVLAHCCGAVHAKSLHCVVPSGLMSEPDVSVCVASYICMMPSHATVRSVKHIMLSSSCKH
jgi:hypothetical protein